MLAAAFPGQSTRAALHRIEHHLAHLSSAFHVCPFEEAAVISVDGFGDFSSAAWARRQGVRLRPMAGFISRIHSGSFIRRHTGIPMVLNTSFNENEPVVCNPRESLDCFLRTQMDWAIQ
jgi:predicted NodU family carbamoyl transferase